MNILEHVEYHGEGVENVWSVHHVEVVAYENIIVYDVAFSGNKTTCYVLLVNEILVIENK